MNMRSSGVVLEETPDNFLVFRKRVLLLVMPNDGSAEAKADAARKLREIISGSRPPTPGHKKRK